MSQPPASTALETLTVIDLTRVRAGPTCVRQFADWGAKVIKIEMPEDGAASTQTDFSARHEPDFQNLHRNKRSMTLNLKNAEGVAVLRRLVERADVVVENYRPDVKTPARHRLRDAERHQSAAHLREHLGLRTGRTLPRSSRRRPDRARHVRADVGDRRARPRTDAGRHRARRPVGRRVCRHGHPGRAATSASAPGRGQWVQTSLLQAQIFMLDFQAARYLMAGEVAGQAGNNHPTGVPTGVFRTADGYVNVAPTPVMWKRFCKAIEREDLIDHPDYATPEGAARPTARN